MNKIFDIFLINVHFYMKIGKITYKLLNILRKWVKKMKMESFSWLFDLEEFISRKDIKIKYITRSPEKHYVFYKEKLLPKIIKTILHKK